MNSLSQIQKKYFYIVALLFLTSITPRPTTPTQETAWPSYASDAAATKFSPLTLINKSNAPHLKLAWQWDSIDNPIIKSQCLDTAYYEATPIMVNSVLYTSTSLNQVVALDPKTGKKLWSYDPETYKNGYPPNSGFVHRGVAYWNKAKEKYIFIGTNDGYLIALNADTGTPIKKFGDNGKVDLTQQLSREVTRDKYGVTSPPLVCKDTIIVGSSIPDFFYRFGMPPGDVRGFDASTGKLKWTFHTIPQIGETGIETWVGDSYKNFGNTNVWAPMSADLKLGAVYLPVSTPSNDYFGGERQGNNLFAESLVSLNCETGERNWHYQLVHHGLWDYDNPAAPILMDLNIHGVPVKAVVQVTKQAFAYVFDRVTGKPIWPMNEISVPQSSVDGEYTSPTQPMPTKPLAFDRQGLSDSDLIDFTPELKTAAKKTISQYTYGPLFTPPSTGTGTINLPGNVGGASWAGAAFNPLTAKLYVPSVTNPHAVTLGHLPFSDFKFASNSSKYLTTPDGLPLTKPPYGRITAIDMNTGDQSWMVPIGTGPRELLESKGATLPPGDLGWPRRTHVLITPNLLFAVQSGYFEITGVHIRNLFANSVKIKATNDDPALRVLDPDTGEQIAKISMPANSYAAPMTYSIDSKQYVVMAIGGGGTNLDAGLIALSVDK